MTITATTTLDERILGAAIGAMELLSIHLGERLGLYDAIRTNGSVTVAELATLAEIHPRYAQEWLEQQAVAGFLVVDDAEAAADERRFRIPAEHLGVLTDPTAADHLAPIARTVAGIAKVIDEVISAYRTGEGVPYSRYGADFRAGQAAINRPAFTTVLVDEWLPAAGDLVHRLHAGGRVADLGCGLGWSTISLATAFPGAEVWGIDADVASIEDARALASAHGVKVRFEAADADQLAGHGPFDAVLILEALHDMARPVDVLVAARKALGRGGAVIVADEAVAERFSAASGDSKPTCPHTASTSAPTGRSASSTTTASRAISSASRVLPTPPGPVIVTRCAPASSASTRARSSARPTNRDRGATGAGYGTVPSRWGRCDR